MIHTSEESEMNVVVFDIYQDQSIKVVEITTRISSFLDTKVL